MALNVCELIIMEFTFVTFWSSTAVSGRFYCNLKTVENFLMKLFKSFLVSGSKCNLFVQLHFVDNELKLVRTIV